MKRSVLVLLAGSVMALGTSQAWALVIPPATPGLAGENIFPIYGASTYCVSDFGWSDTWLAPVMNTYDQARDVLSGDDAANLKYEDWRWPSPRRPDAMVDAEPGRRQAVCFLCDRFHVDCHHAAPLRRA